MADSFVAGAFRACQVPGFGVKHAGAAQVRPVPGLRFAASGLADGVLDQICRQRTYLPDRTGIEAAICVNDGRIGRSRLRARGCGEQRQQTKPKLPARIVVACRRSCLRFQAGMTGSA